MFGSYAIWDYLAAVIFGMIGGFVRVLSVKNGTPFKLNHVLSQLFTSAVVGAVLMLIAHESGFIGGWIAVFCIIGGYLGQLALDAIVKIVSKNLSLNLENGKPKEKEPEPKPKIKEALSIILAVDDTDSYLAIITNALQDDYNVYTIRNPEKVTKFLERISPNLFIVDYLMPEMTGVELINVINDEYPEHRNTPKLMLTGSDCSDTMIEAEAAGVNKFMTKPFVVSEFKKAVADLTKTGCPDC